MKKLFFEKLGNYFLVFFFIFLFFLPNIFKGKLPIPADAVINLYHPFRDVPFQNYIPGHFPAKNTLITDPVLQTYPWKYLVIKNLKLGLLPLWNPYSFSGQPLLANFQSSSLQFTNILFFILPFNIAWTINIILPSLLLGVFTYLFLKEIGTESAVAVFASTALPFTGFFVAWMEWGIITNTAMWLPLILMAIAKIYKKISPIWFLVLIFSIFQTFSSGHFQTALYVLIAAAIYVLFIQISQKKLTPIVTLGCALILGLLISSPQLISTLEFSNLSARSTDSTYDPSRADWFMPPMQTIQIISPDFFGNPTTNNYWGVWNYGEFATYASITILSLAIFGIAFSKKDRNTKFLITLLIISFTLATKNPISELPYTLKVPFISTMQPSRIIFLLDFSLVILSAIGLKYLLEEKNIFKKIAPPIFIFSVLCLIAVFTLSEKQYFPLLDGNSTAQIALRNLLVPAAISLSLILIYAMKLKKNYFIALIFVITIVDLFRFANKFIPFTSSSIIFPKTKTIEFLQAQQRPFRTIATDRRILHPNISSFYGIESIEGYDPLYLSSYAKLVSSWQSQSGDSSVGSFGRIVTPQKLSTNVLNLLNIKYVISFDNLNTQNLEPVFEEGETKVYQNTSFLPRAFFVREVKKVESQDQQLKELSQNDFSSSVTATSPDVELTSNTDGALNITRYTDQSIDLETYTQEKSPLVISNINYPGWQALIDNQPTNILTADGVFQMLLVPAGNHHIKLFFYPKSFEDSIKLMLLGLALSAGLTVLIWRKKFQ